FAPSQGTRGDSVRERQRVGVVRAGCVGLPSNAVVWSFGGYGVHRDLRSFPTRRSSDLRRGDRCASPPPCASSSRPPPRPNPLPRSEEHTSELQPPGNLVCRLLLEKKNRVIVCPDIEDPSALMLRDVPLASDPPAPRPEP